MHVKRLHKNMREIQRRVFAVIIIVITLSQENITDRRFNLLDRNLLFNLLTVCHFGLKIWFQ